MKNVNKAGRPKGRLNNSTIRKLAIKALEEVIGSESVAIETRAHAAIVWLNNREAKPGTNVNSPKRTQNGTGS